MGGTNFGLFRLFFVLFFRRKKRKRLTRFFFLLKFEVYKKIILYK